MTNNDILCLVAGVMSTGREAHTIENSDMNPLLRHEIILKLGYHILARRTSNFEDKILKDQMVIDMIERVCNVKLEDIDFGIFFIQNITSQVIGYSFYTKNVEDMDFDKILEHLLLIYKTDLEDFGKKFTEHRLRKDVYDRSLIKLYTASEENPIPN